MLKDDSVKKTVQHFHPQQLSLWSKMSEGELLHPLWPSGVKNVGPSCSVEAKQFVWNNTFHLSENLSPSYASCLRTSKR